jgi:hypothetical protein
MTILGLRVPEGQRLWFWNAGGDHGCLLFAKDHNEAYAKSIAARVEGHPADEAGYAEWVKAAIQWFAKNDELVEIETEVVCEPCTHKLLDKLTGFED